MKRTDSGAATAKPEIDKELQMLVHSGGGILSRLWKG
jgi:hypothetical protein